MRTVEGRARNHPSVLKNNKDLLQEVARFEEIRNQGGSRLQEGKKGSAMVIENEGREFQMFVSQHDERVGHNELIGLESDRPKSRVDIEEGEFQVREAFEGQMSFDKSNKLVNETQRSGDSTNKDSFFLATSGYHD